MDFFITIVLASIYINSSCYCGPNLDVSKIKLLPQVIGPNFLSRVLQDTVQSLVDIALQTKNAFSMLRPRQGDGDVVVRGKTIRIIPSKSNSLFSNSSLEVRKLYFFTFSFFLFFFYFFK